MGRFTFVTPEPGKTLLVLSATNQSGLVDIRYEGQMLPLSCVTSSLAVNGSKALHCDTIQQRYSLSLSLALPLLRGPVPKNQDGNVCGILETSR